MSIRTRGTYRMAITSDRAQRRGSGRVWNGAVGTVVLSTSGCAVVPSVNILGSFFPAWLISIFIGVVLTVLTHQAFVIARIAPYVRPAAAAYVGLILLWTLTAWLVVFAS